ncbi:2-oxo acid dehydrogenase subunit E2 [Roseivirga sp. BDSF3-8]|uniref:2-oxo acid dehydrogenase subunit E2 n=1 Tax=Roseivirga sp. BDSF3-8 TaxID=3241598 RepID=UPI0035325112
MPTEVKVPQISEGADTATVAEILVSEGDTIQEEESIIVVETDKASVEVPSTHSGKVTEIKISEGDELQVGDVILLVEEEGEEDDEESKKDESGKEAEEEEQESKEAKEDDSKDEEDETDTDDDEAEVKESEEESEKTEEDEKQKETKAEKDDTEEKKKDKYHGDGPRQDENESRNGEEKDNEVKEDDNEDDGIPAAPGVRRQAREQGVDLTTVEGTGPEGRITSEDVEKAAGKKGGGGDKTPTSSSLPDFSKWGDTERKPLSGIRKATALNTTSAWQTIPHVTQFDEADITDIEAYRQEHSEKAEEAGGKLTVTAILTKIVANALRKFPEFNASVDMENEEVVYKKYVHIGIAADTEQGLLVPVVRHADRKNMIELSVEITRLAEKARDGKLAPDDMLGGNFTISNLGGIGGTNFTPIVYSPQVAILGVARAEIKPVYNGETFEPKQVLPLSLSYDHRIIDGAAGARFLRWICQALEDPYAALLGA